MATKTPTPLARTIISSPNNYQLISDIDCQVWTFNKIDINMAKAYHFDLQGPQGTHLRFVPHIHHQCELQPYFKTMHLIQQFPIFRFQFPWVVAHLHISAYDQLCTNISLIEIDMLTIDDGSSID